MSEHTPGPWEITTGSATPYCGISARLPQGKVAMIAVRVPRNDARLIAASPDLFEAGKRIQGCGEMRDYGSCGDCMGELEKALAKAKGLAP